MSKSLLEHNSFMFGCNALNMTQVELKLITDADIYVFIEKGTKGTVTYISKRKIKANNNYLKSNDPKEELKHITYLDENNLMAMLYLNFFQQVDLNDKEMYLFRYENCQLYFRG